MILNKLATKHVGDGVPNNENELDDNLFFVTLESSTFLVTSDPDLAYKTWLDLPNNRESMLEDRLNGVICSTERENEDGTGRWICIDDFARFIKIHVDYVLESIDQSWGQD